LKLEVGRIFSMTMPKLLVNTLIFRKVMFIFSTLRVISREKLLTFLAVLRLIFLLSILAFL